VGIQEAYEIVNGELGSQFETIFSGNTLETLQKVDAVGKDFGSILGGAARGRLRL
jgi:predicted Zn-dependent protease